MEKAIYSKKWNLLNFSIFWKKLIKSPDKFTGLIKFKTNKMKINYPEILEYLFTDLSSGGFGLKIMSNLVKQLKGTYKFPISNNFLFEMEFTL